MPLRERELGRVLAKYNNVVPATFRKPFPCNLQKGLAEVDEVDCVKGRYRTVFVHHLDIMP